MIVRGGVALVGAATLIAYLDHVWWPFELATFFRVQYAVLLLVLGLAALVRRDAAAAAIAVVLAAANIATVAPHWSPRRTPQPLGRDRVRLVFANVDVSNRDHAAVARYLAREDADLIGITELSPAWQRALAPVLRSYPYRALHVEDDAYGIGLFSKRPLTSARVTRYPSKSGPATIVARFRLAGRVVTLVLTHPHTPFAGSVHQRQLSALASARPSWGPRALVCGDLNTPPWSGPIRAFMRKTLLADSHRGYGFESSWPSWGWPLRVPLDNCLVSRGLAVVARSRGPSLGSDHFPLIVELAATPLEPRRVTG